MAACHHCGAELPERARYCPECGSRADIAAAEERKLVSVLFADLVGSTADASSRDPEDVRAAVQPKLARMRDELERFGGTVEKYVGDAVMAVFGAPVAHEDDAERAVRAALAIRDALGSAVKVAVNTGEAVVAMTARPEAGEAMASGDVLNTTYRIEEATPAGAVLVGDATYRATGTAIAYGEQRRVEAKGKHEPLVVWEALHARGAPGSIDDRAPLAPLVGRREELALVIDTVARAKRDSTVQLLTLVGAPGIGKSRLVWELQRALADDPGLVTWRRGRCLPYGDAVTFWALGEIVKEQAGILETDDDEATSAKLRRAVRDLLADPAEAEWVEAHLAPVVGLTGELPTRERRAESFTAWRRFFEALAEWGPLVLVVEDVHWADDGLLEFLDHVADWATTSPLVLLCTARPEIHERRRQWGARRNAATISLPPLSEAETRKLVSLLLRQADVPPELARTVLGHAEGNPLYTEEFIRMLVERSLLQRDGGGWQLRATEVPLPESVQGIIAARLDALPAEQKALLQDAAVIGRTFWIGALAATSGRAEHEIEHALRELEHREFVRRERESSVAQQAQYVFRHTLVRDVAYNQIPRSQRSDKHLRVADWFTEIVTGRQDRVELLAHHLWKATMLTRAVGRDESELALRAREALREAGERAAALSSHESAANYFSAAVELWPDDEPDRYELLLKLGRAEFASTGRGVDALTEAVEGLRRHGRRSAAADAHIGLSRVAWLSGDRTATRSHADAARALVADAPASAEKARVLGEVANYLTQQDDYDAALETAREALELSASLGLSDIQGQLLTTIGSTRIRAGDPDGIKDLEQGVKLLRQSGSSALGFAYQRLAAAHVEFGDLRRAADAYTLAWNEAERFSDEPSRVWLQGERVGEYYWSGRWEEAKAAAERFLAPSESGRHHYLESFCRCLRGQIRLAEGDVDGASADAMRALHAAETAADSQLVLPARAFLARVHASRGEPERAADEAKRAIARLTGRESGEYCWIDFAIVLSDTGRGEELVRVLEAGPKRTRWRDAAVAFAQGRYDDAAALYAEIGSLPDERVARERAATTTQPAAAAVPTDAA